MNLCLLVSIKPLRVLRSLQHPPALQISSFSLLQDNYLWVWGGYTMPFRAFPFPIHRGRTVDANGQCSPSVHLSSHLSSSMMDTFFFLLTKIYNWTHGLTHMCCSDLNKWGTSLLDEFGRSVMSAASPIGGSKQHKAAQQVSDSRITAHQLSLWGRNMAEWRKDTFFLSMSV